MKKKKVLIVTHKIVMGGIEKSLISMINAIDREKYDVDVFVVEEGGELLKDIPEWVNVKVIPGSNKNIIERIFTTFRSGNLIDSLSILNYTILTRLTKKSYKGFYYYPKINTKVNNEYDLAIAYHTPLGFPTGYVIDKIKAKKKILYIHGDMDQYSNKKEFSILIKLYKKYFSKYDKIFCVSNQAKEKFLKYYSELENRTEVFYNILNRSEIILKSLDNDNFEDCFNGARILTIGRLSEEKGQLIIPKVLRRLIDNNINVKWYCVGEGSLRRKIEEEAIKLSVQDNLVLLGIKNNPYKFIKNSDIYVQTSLYEGFCITLAEAKILNKPIVTTNFVGASDQIINGENGLIVNYNDNEIYNAILQLIQNKELVNKFKINLEKNTNDYSDGIKKIYKLIT